MKSIFLSGYNIHISVDDGRLIIKDGRDFEKEPTRIVYKPRSVDFDQIILYGHTGNVTISAMKWLMKHKVSIQLMDYNGRLLTTMNPPQAKNGFAKMGQYRAYENKRIEIGKKFIEAKLIRSDTILQWLMERYPHIKPHHRLSNLEKSLEDLRNASTTKEILGIEGMFARHYWDALGEIFPDKFKFESRGYTKAHRPLNAVDHINALFNYGYSVLEGICLRAVNIANLDPYIGFVHEVRSNKSPLVYDMMEPFRWLVDKTIIQGLEANRYHKKDFLRTDDYVIRLRPKAVKKLIEDLDSTFSQQVKFKKLNRQWKDLIIMHSQDLSKYLIGSSKSLSFDKPNVKLNRIDNADLREKILSIPYVEWEKMGYSKGTLHYMKQNAKSDKPFTLNHHVRERLEGIGDM